MGEEENRLPEEEPVQMQAPPPPVASGGMTENTWAMMVHLSALSGVFIPFGNIFGPLIFWIIKKDEMPVIDRHGKEALNFQISFTIFMTVASIISGILTIVIIGFFMLMALIPVYYILIVLFPVLAGLKANEGGWYDYPMTIRFIK